jgi:hypothetical protein
MAIPAPTPCSVLLPSVKICIELLSSCMHVYMYVCTRLYVCVYVYVCTYVYMYVFMYVRMYECMYLCMYVCASLYICMCVFFNYYLLSMLQYKHQYYMLHCTFVLLYRCRGCSGQLDHWIPFTVVIIAYFEHLDTEGI